MSRIRYVFGKDKKLYPENAVPPEIGRLYDQHNTGGAPAVHMDYPDFVSPIDGTVVKGRRGLRDHCRTHDVVPTRELAGLQAGVPKQEPDRAAIRKELIKAVYK